MLDFKLEIDRVNYKKCVELLLPPLVEHCAAKTAPNELDRFLASLGSDAVGAACAVLDRMDADSRDTMVVWLAASHEERMRNSANRHLSELFGAPIVRVGHFTAVDRPGTRLSLLATQVQADYGALLKNRLVTEGVERIGEDNLVLKGAAKLALQMGGFLSAESLERQCIRLLNSERVKERLMTVLADSVRQAGLDVTVSDVTVEQTPAGVALSQAGTAAMPADYERRLMAELQKEAQRLRAARG